MPHPRHHEIFVCSNKDDGPRTLRDAVNRAKLSNTEFTKIIILPAVGCEIVIHREIIVDSNIKIINKTKNDLTIRAVNSRIFHVSDTVSLFKIVSEFCQTITLSHGNAETGGAILVEPNTNNSKLILKGVVFTKCYAERLGGAICTSGDVILKSSIIHDNEAVIQGGGIWALKNVSLFDSCVNNNRVLLPEIKSGGAGIFIDDGDCRLDNSRVSHNSTAFDLNNKKGGSGGGIIVMTGSIYLLNNSHIDHNLAYNSGGIQEGIGNVYISNKSSSSHNRSLNGADAAGGGGITIVQGNVDIIDGEISNNDTNGMYSGGIVSLVGDIIISNSKINYNKNSGPGGGIAMNFGNVIVTDSEVSSNTGASLGGAIVNFTPGTGKVVVTNSKINNNILTNAQVINQTVAAFIVVITESLLGMIEQAKVSGGSGGQTFIDSVPAIIKTLVSVYEQLQNLPGEILNNNMGGGGIACLLSTNVIITNTRIESNYSGKLVSQENVPYTSLGGAILVYNAISTFRNNIIYNNKTTTDGGGIYNNGKLTLSLGKITNNVAENNGGGIYSTKNINTNSTIIKNNTPNDVVIFS